VWEKGGGEDRVAPKRYRVGQFGPADEGAVDDPRPSNTHLLVPGPISSQFDGYNQMHTKAKIAFAFPHPCFSVLKVRCCAGVTSGYIQDVSDLTRHLLNVAPWHLLTSRSFATPPTIEMR
jgi:hypothetical protein